MHADVPVNSFVRLTDGLVGLNRLDSELVTIAACITLASNIS